MNTLATHYSFVGEYEKASELQNLVLQKFRLIGDRKGEADTLANIGYRYYSLGEMNTALTYYNESLDIYRVIGNQYYVGTMIANLGDVYVGLGDLRQGLDHYEEALGFIRLSGDTQWEALTLNSMGAVYIAQQENERALTAYRRALTLFHSLGDRRWEGNTLNGMGSVYMALSQRAHASECFKEALVLNESIADLGGEALTRYNLTLFERAAGNSADAILEIERVLNIDETLGARLISQQSRASYFANVRRHYEMYVDLLMQANKSSLNAELMAKAFENSEKARARLLLESLSESQANIREGVDPDLVQRESSIQRELNGKAERRVQSTAGPNDPEILALNAEIDQLSLEYDQLQTQIRTRSPRYAELFHPQALTVSQIQQRLLDDDTVLIEYMLGDDRSYVWTITRNEISTHELPPRREIDESARRLYGLLTARQPGSGDQELQNENGPPQTGAQLAVEIQKLSAMLVDPIASKLRQRLLLIPLNRS